MENPYQNPLELAQFPPEKEKGSIVSPQFQCEQEGLLPMSFSKHYKYLF